MFMGLLSKTCGINCHAEVQIKRRTVQRDTEHHEDYDKVTDTMKKRRWMEVSVHVNPKRALLSTSASCFYVINELQLKQLVQYEETSEQSVVSGHCTETSRRLEEDEHFLIFWNDLCLFCRNHTENLDWKEVKDCLRVTKLCHFFPLLKLFSH